VRQPLDTNAADQFQPIHRSGHGAITFEGREWTRLEWIERTARNGGTLAAGEGAVLCAEIDRVRGDAERFRLLASEFVLGMTIAGVDPIEEAIAIAVGRGGDEPTDDDCLQGVRVAVDALRLRIESPPTGTLCDDPCEDLPNCHCGERT
jgi:hypothetical protein